MSRDERAAQMGATAKSLATAAPAASPTAAASAPIRSETLLGGAREVQIEHHGVIYRLKETALGKLILTK